LRFRENQSPRIIQLGDDAKLAGRVLQELSMLRSALCPRRELQRAVQQGRQLLRHVKYQLRMVAPDFDLQGKTGRSPPKSSLQM
jgi:hypothetical protein